MLARVLYEVEQRLDADAAHDLGHLFRVADWTVRLSGDIEPRTSIAAALLHDVVNVPKNHADRGVGERAVSRRRARGAAAVRV